jgi:uncharacterized iron-regulated membrane protein
MNMSIDNASTRTARRRSLLWRLHFWSALIASPFAVIAASTGLLYVFTPQIESALYAHLDTVTPQAEVKPLDDAVDAAQQTMPAGWMLHSVSPAQDADDSVKVAFMPQGGHANHAAERPNRGVACQPAGPW